MQRSMGQLLTFRQILEALHCDLELEGVCEHRGVIQHHHVDDIYERHVLSTSVGIKICDPGYT